MCLFSVGSVSMAHVVCILFLPGTIVSQDRNDDSLSFRVRIDRTSSEEWAHHYHFDLALAVRPPLAAPTVALKLETSEEMEDSSIDKDLVQRLSAEFEAFGKKEQVVGLHPSRVRWCFLAR
mgnify:CR=1 FL=1